MKKVEGLFCADVDMSTKTKWEYTRTTDEARETIEGRLFRIMEDSGTTAQEKADMFKRIKAICDSYLRDELGLE